MMAHPIHLHGHAFQVVAIDDRPIQGAVRDTVLVTPMGSVRIAFDANNPGRWAFHCHQPLPHDDRHDDGVQVLGNRLLTI
jgi:FtsP/CotA-like multicopper oxidase with cupredoxin domain